MLFLLDSNLKINSDSCIYSQVKGLLSIGGNRHHHKGLIIKIITALLDFVSIPIKNKPAVFNSILNHLTDNIYFTTIDPPLAALRLAVDNLEQAILAADDGSHIAISAMHDSDKAVTLLFKNLVGYVNRIANGNLTKILSSGFTPSSQPAAHDKAVLAITDAPHSGSVKATTQTVDRAGAYHWEKRITTGAGVKGEWVAAGLTTQSTIILEGFEVGAIVEVKVRAVTPAGTTDFCAPVSKLVN